MPRSSRRLVHGESGLPEGDPAGRGLSLSDDIPGTRTFAKPEDAAPEETEQEKHDRKPGQREVNEQDADADSSYSGAGAHDSSSKTRYPYRTGLPTTHSASTYYVLGAWQSAAAPVVRIAPGTRTKIALSLGEITEGLNPAVVQRARRCVVSLKRADVKNLRWIFSVDCGNVPRVVRLKAHRDKNVAKIVKMDLDMTCSCPAWQWSGAEHHAMREDYNDGKPRGTASVPVIRDPTGINRVCKHVSLVLDHVQDWTISKKRKK